MSQTLPNRGRVPPGTEDASEAAWRDYEACCAELDEQLARSHATAAAQTYQAIRRASGGRAPRRAVMITVDRVLRLARSHARVCPLPGPWQCLFLLLPQGAPAPIPAQAWDRTPDFEKQRRLREQIEWAARHGALTRLHDCLGALREQDWHRLPVLRWPALEAGPSQG